MNAIETALSLMDARQEWLAEMHTSTAIRNGGIAIWEPDVVLLGWPHDPIDGDDEHCFHILFVAGDPLRLGKEAEKLCARGYTHVIWHRGFKSGTQADQKHDLRRWARLVQRLNRRHG